MKIYENLSYVPPIGEIFIDNSFNLMLDADLAGVTGKNGTLLELEEEGKEVEEDDGTDVEDKQDGNFLGGEEDDGGRSITKL